MHLCSLLNGHIAKVKSVEKQVIRKCYGREKPDSQPAITNETRLDRKKKLQSADADENKAEMH